MNVKYGHSKDKPIYVKINKIKKESRVVINDKRPKQLQIFKDKRNIAATKEISNFSQDKNIQKVLNKTYENIKNEKENLAVKSLLRSKSFKILSNVEGKKLESQKNNKDKVDINLLNRRSPYVIILNKANDKINKKENNKVNIQYSEKFEKESRVIPNNEKLVKGESKIIFSKIKKSENEVKIISETNEMAKNRSITKIIIPNMIKKVFYKDKIDKSSCCNLSS